MKPGVKLRFETLQKKKVSVSKRIRNETDDAANKDKYKNVAPRIDNRHKPQRRRSDEFPGYDKGVTYTEVYDDLVHFR